MDVSAVRGHSRIVSENANEVFGEGRGDRAERGRADEHELGPAEKKGRQPSPRLSNEDVDSAGTRKHTGDLRQRQRSAKSEDPASEPDREQRKRTSHLIRDARRRSKNSRANCRADQNGDRAP